MARSVHCQKRTPTACIWQCEGKFVLWLIALVLALLSVDLVNCLLVQSVVLALNHLCSAPSGRNNLATTA
jgi:hypothetical protein